jgi:hypothetical protein
VESCRDGRGGATRVEGRFKSVAILDEESLLATCASIDLNAVAARIAQVREASPHTSIKERVDHAKAHGRIADLNQADRGSIAGSKASGAPRSGLLALEDVQWVPDSHAGRSGSSPVAGTTSVWDRGAAIKTD